MWAFEWAEFEGVQAEFLGFIYKTLVEVEGRARPTRAKLQVNIFLNAVMRSTVHRFPAISNPSELFELDKRLGENSAT
jgi:hypothetical protein